MLVLIYLSAYGSCKSSVSIEDQGRIQNLWGRRLAGAQLGQILDCGHGKGFRMSIPRTSGYCVEGTQRQNGHSVGGFRLFKRLLLRRVINDKTQCEKGISDAG